MSTGSAIACKDGHGFAGVYHHWDGYPSGLGQTLFQLRNGHFKRDTQAMLKFLIDEHPQGWSTIVGADFTIPPGPTPDRNKQLCKDCYRPIWAHFKQYYSDTNPLWLEAGRPPLPVKTPDGVYKLFSCSAEPHEMPHGPECYGKSESGLVTDLNAGGCGCEYAYVFDGNGAMEVKSSYTAEGAMMIGAFGCGDPDSKWKTIGVVNLDDLEPDWSKMEA